MAVCVSLTWKTGDELEASFVIIASYVHEEEEMSDRRPAQVSSTIVVEYPD